jgi:hypothetical protein
MKKNSLPFSHALLAGLMIASIPGFASAKSMSTVIGVSPAPPLGAGPGRLTVLPLRHGDKPYIVKFGRAGTASGNSFYIAERQGIAYVPSVAGYTDVINIHTRKKVQRFHSIAGGRVAVLSKDGDELFVLSGKKLAAYTTKDGAQRYQLDFGGNAMVLNKDGSRLFVGGNMDKSIAMINTDTGLVLRRIPIGHSGDLAWANGKLFSADMKSGVMSVYNPATDKTYKIKTPETDPNFSYHRIPKARAGFMQLAVSPDRQYIYAAGFSGHILRFSTRRPAYLGEVAVTAGKSAANKLSGLAVLDNGRRAISTIENRHESVIVNLQNGHVIERLPHVASNRWVVTS